MTTGERIKYRRKELGMTQSELAAKVGYSDKSSIAIIENGRNNLRQSKIQAFADALNCDPLWLIGLGTAENEPQKPQLSAHDEELLTAYHAADPECKRIINYMLKLKKKSE